VSGDGSSDAGGSSANGGQVAVGRSNGRADSGLPDGVSAVGDGATDGAFNVDDAVANAVGTHWEGVLRRQATVTAYARRTGGGGVSGGGESGSGGFGTGVGGAGGAMPTVADDHDKDMWGLVGEPIAAALREVWARTTDPRLLRRVTQSWRDMASLSSQLGDRAFLCNVVALLAAEAVEGLRAAEDGCEDDGVAAYASTLVRSFCRQQAAATAHQRHRSGGVGAEGGERHAPPHRHGSGRRRGDGDNTDSSDDEVHVKGARGREERRSTQHQGHRHGAVGGHTASSDGMDEGATVRVLSARHLASVDHGGATTTCGMAFRRAVLAMRLSLHLGAVHAVELDSAAWTPLWRLVGCLASMDALPAGVWPRDDVAAPNGMRLPAALDPVVELVSRHALQRLFPDHEGSESSVAGRSHTAAPSPTAGVSVDIVRLQHYALPGLLDGSSHLRALLDGGGGGVAPAGWEGGSVGGGDGDSVDASDRSSHAALGDEPGSGSGWSASDGPFPSDHREGRKQAAPSARRSGSLAGTSAPGGRRGARSLSPAMLRSGARRQVSQRSAASGGLLQSIAALLAGPGEEDGELAVAAAQWREESMLLLHRAVSADVSRTGWLARLLAAIPALSGQHLVTCTSAALQVADLRHLGATAEAAWDRLAASGRVAGGVASVGWQDLRFAAPVMVVAEVMAMVPARHRLHADEGALSAHRVLSWVGADLPAPSSSESTATGPKGEFVATLVTALRNHVVERVIAGVASAASVLLLDLGAAEADACLTSPSPHYPSLEGATRLLRAFASVPPALVPDAAPHLACWVALLSRASPRWAHAAELPAISATPDALDAAANRMCAFLDALFDGLAQAQPFFFAAPGVWDALYSLSSMGWVARVHADLPAAVVATPAGVSAVLKLHRHLFTHLLHAVTPYLHMCAHQRAVGGLAAAVLAAEDDSSVLVEAGSGGTTTNVTAAGATAEAPARRQSGTPDGRDPGARSTPTRTRSSIGRYRGVAAAPPTTPILVPGSGGGSGGVGSTSHPALGEVAGPLLSAGRRTVYRDALLSLVVDQPVADLRQFAGQAVLRLLDQLVHVLVPPTLSAQALGSDVVRQAADAHWAVLVNALRAATIHLSLPLEWYAPDGATPQGQPRSSPPWASLEAVVLPLPPPALATTLTPADCHALVRVQPVLLRSCLTLLQRTLLAAPALTCWIDGGGDAGATVIHHPGPAAWLAVWTEAVEPLLQWCLPAAPPPTGGGDEALSHADVGRWASLDGAQNVVGLANLAVKAAIRLAEAGSDEMGDHTGAAARGTVSDEAISGSWSRVMEATSKAVRFEAWAAAGAGSGRDRGATASMDTDVVSEAITEALRSGCVVLATSVSLRRRLPLLRSLLRIAVDHGVAGAAALCDALEEPRPVPPSPSVPLGVQPNQVGDSAPPPTASGMHAHDSDAGEAAGIAAVDAEAAGPVPVSRDALPHGITTDVVPLPGDSTSAEAVQVAGDPSAPLGLPDASGMPPPAAAGTGGAAGNEAPLPESEGLAGQGNGTTVEGDSGNASGSSGFLPSWLTSWVGGR